MGHYCLIHIPFIISIPNDCFIRFQYYGNIYTIVSIFFSTERENNSILKFQAVQEKNEHTIFDLTSIRFQL